MHKSSLILVCYLILAIPSCSLIKTITVKTTGSIIYDASYEVETENSWQRFKDGVPANLKLVEGFHHVDPGDQDLLVSLTKGYAGYGYGVHETLFLGDQLKDRTESFHKEQAISNFTKALHYGLLYLKEEGIEYDDFVKNMRKEGGVVELLNSKLSNDKRDLEAVFFTAQALGGLVNLQRTDMSLVSQLPIVKEMFDWVCTNEPEINFGACPIFYGAYEAGRPKFLGGNPEKGKKIFLEAIKKYPDNFLVRVAFMQFYLIPMMDEEGYKNEKFHLEKFSQETQEKLSWKPANRQKLDMNSHLNIYNSIALKRYGIIKKFEKDIF